MDEKFDIKGFFKRNLAVVICAVLALIVIIFSGVMVSGQKSMVDEQQVELNNLSNRLKTKQIENRAVKDEIVKTTTGLQMDRVVADNKKIAEFFDVVCTWSTYEEYNIARNRVMSEYHIDKDSDFMKTFMPVVGNKTATKDGKVVNYNSIDSNGYNMKYDSMKSYVTDISGNSYQYFTIINITTSSDNGGEAVTQAAVEYTTDSSHNILDIKAVPVV